MLLKLNIMAVRPALSVILAVPSVTLALIIIRYVSKFYTKKDFEQIRYLRGYFLKMIGYAALIGLVIFIILSPQIAAYLKMDSLGAVLIAGAMMVLALIAAVFPPMLTGMQKFKSIGCLFFIRIFF